MKTIGLIGGMSWESTVEYYRIINQEVSRRLGGFHSGKILMYSVDFGEVESLMREGKWDRIGDRVAAIARTLEAGGADLVLLCTNTVHKVADRIETAVQVPFIHIADATGDAIVGKGLTRVGLLGTRYTMEEDFYRERLAQKFGLSVLIPPDEKRGMINDVIFNELCKGVVKPSSRNAFKGVIEELGARGAQGIILGCTEIPMLMGSEDCGIPLLDTTRIHALRAVDHALD
ncbi:aspartate/glutamate racemase family protein [Desulforhabdus sp. TSK]|uniref:aspartate/glutamate racemase family protein n=1 Tax=Desulforhabdus sp. TSK TaxID=2925014 RepID=UPI001FC7C3DF|nr:aspartate/glutamate racemase family protein [Desulforhabdus sp. TSK]GKT10016.1 racemase [Desulforhabdus sp. TSK]